MDTTRRRSRPKKHRLVRARQLHARGLLVLRDQEHSDNEGPRALVTAFCALEESVALVRANVDGAIRCRRQALRRDAIRKDDLEKGHPRSQGLVATPEGRLRLTPETYNQRPVSAISSADCVWPRADVRCKEYVRAV